jgi:hypothetical protein
MLHLYDSLQAGDHVYFVERRKMAFCRVLEVRRDPSRPDYTEYVLDIVEQWYDHEFFEPISILFSGKRLTVSRTEGMAYNGMWQFYTADEFAKYYGPLPSRPENLAQIRFEFLLRRGLIASAIVLIILALLLIAVLLLRP